MGIIVGRKIGAGLGRTSYGSGLVHRIHAALLQNGFSTLSLPDFVDAVGEIKDFNDSTNDLYPTFNTFMVPGYKAGAIAFVQINPVDENDFSIIEMPFTRANAAEDTSVAASTYFDANGNLKEIITANLPRLTFDYQGRINPYRRAYFEFLTTATNYIQRSDDGESSWVQNAVTNTNEADGWVKTTQNEVNSNPNTYLNIGAASGPGETHEGAFDIHSDLTSDGVRVSVFEGGAGSGGASIEYFLLEGSCSLSLNGWDLQITNIQSEFVRIGFRMVSQGANSISLYIKPWAFEAVNGSYIRWRAATLTKDLSGFNRIPTDTIDLTREYDRAPSFNIVANSFVTNTQGTVLFDIITPVVKRIDSSVAIQIGTTGNRIFFYNSNTTPESGDIYVQTATGTTAIQLLEDASRCIISWEPGRIIININGHDVADVAESLDISGNQFQVIQALQRYFGVRALAYSQNFYSDLAFAGAWKNKEQMAADLNYEILG